MNIAMLISGGVDSSVSLRLLQDAGHIVHAFYLKIWLEDEMAFLGECPWEEDLKYVRAVCEQAGIPLEVVPFQKEYWERVVSYTIAEVKAGRTPNPDVLCNAQIKFGAFLDFLEKKSSPELVEGYDNGKVLRQAQDNFVFDKIATGHYAQVEDRDGQTFLKMSPDPIKDQTYFLSQLTQPQVAKALFPIGHLHKEEVRALAAQYDLPNATRKDSQGICFLGKIAFDKFLEFHLGKKPGDIIDLKTGEKIGTHDGFWFYTIGQRRGIRLSGGPWYVVKKDTGKNLVYVSNQYRSEEMFRDTFEVGDLSFISGETPAKKWLSVKLRHGEKVYACEVVFLENGDASVKLLDDEDKGISPGQFAVFYDGEYCLGGGVIV